MNDPADSAKRNVHFTDYDAVAEAFDHRYRNFEYRGIRRALEAFLNAPRLAVLEVGCGTGHWLTSIRRSDTWAVGVDPSRGMLAQALGKGCGGRVVAGDALALPFHDGTFDRIVCVHALHHFPDPARFFREAFRVLRPGGGVITFDLDPFNEQNVWYVYRFFDGTLQADRQRYLSRERIRQEMDAAGFERVQTFEADHFQSSVEAGEARRRGMLSRACTSQLTDLDEGAYQAGLRRIENVASSRGAEGLILETDVLDYGTQGWRPA